MLLSIAFLTLLHLLVPYPAVVTKIGHPFHVSVAEMEYNPETQCLEVALRVWPEDLEQALQNESAEKVTLEDTGIDDKIAAYLGKNIRISPDGKNPCELNWIGKELEIKQAWLYFEVKTGVPPEDFSFSNTLFFELHPDQINIFNLKFKGRRASLSFAKDKATHRLTDKDFVPIRNPFAYREN